MPGNITLSRPDMLYSAAEMPRPLDAAAWFGRPGAPLALEIGCGTGHFLARMATRHPDWNWLGVEISLKYARISAWKLERDGLAHARVLNADSRDVLRHILAPGSVAAAFILFSDPWFKKRHLKRRLFDPDYAASLARVLRPGAPLHIKTDITAYHEQIVEAFAAAPQFRPLAAGDTPAPPPAWDGIVTNYERKALAAGRPIHYHGFILENKG